MKDFKRVVMPGTVPDWREGRAPIPVYLKIELKGGRLSISGVEGPMSNGNALGGCGQIVDTLARKDFLPAGLKAGFPLEVVAELRAVWERWHLNDMRSECEHQTALGWREMAARVVKLYHWRLGQNASKKQKSAEEAALAALRNGKAFKPTKDQAHYAALPYEKTTTTDTAPEEYDARTSLYPGMTGPIEEKGLGWLYEHEHPEGLMCKPCPTCGYKRGSEWRTEVVPEKVLAFLSELPEVDKLPAWV